MCGFCREEQELFEEMMIEGLVGHDSELYLSVKRRRRHEENNLAANGT